MGKTVGKLNQLKSLASPSQKIAIERINPIMAELAMTTRATIYHLNKEKGRFLNNEEHKEYLKTNAGLAAKTAGIVSHFVDYGETKTKFEELQRKLEISEGAQGGRRRGVRTRRTARASNANAPRVRPVGAPPSRSTERILPQKGEICQSAKFVFAK